MAVVGEAFVKISPDGAGFSKRAEQQMMGSVSGLAKKAAATFAAGFVIDKAASAFVESIGLASDLGEATSKAGVVFGDFADEVEQFASTAPTALGQTRAQALEATGTFGNLLRSVGLTEETSAKFSTSMVGLASDLASFNNTDPAEALDALRAGLVGETEPLKRFGVNINEALLKQKAMELGLSDGKTALDSNAKAQAAYALIMEQTALAQGDFERTSDGLANQQRILSASWTEAKTALGAGLLPALTSVMPAITEMVNGLAPALGDIGGAFGQALGAIGPELGVLIGEIAPLVGDIVGVFSGVAPGIFAVLEQVLGGIAPIVDALAGPFAAVAGTITTLMNAGLSALMPVLVSLAEAIGPVVELLANGLGMAIQAMAPLLVEMGAAFADLVATLGGGLLDALSVMLPPLLEVAGVMIDALKPVLPVLAKALGDVAGALGDALLSAVTALAPIISELAPLFGEVLSAMAGAGGTIIQQLAKVVVTLVEALAPLVESLLPPLGELFGVIGEVLVELAPVIGQIATLIGDALLTVIEALAPSLPALGDAFGQIAGALGDVLLAIVPILPPLLELVTMLIEKIGVPVLVGLATAFAKLAEALLPIVVAITDILAAGLVFLVDNLVKLITAITNIDPAAIGRAFASIGESIGGALVTIGDFLEGLPGKAVEMVGNIAAAVLELPGKLLDLTWQLVAAGLELGKSVFNGIVSGLSGLGDMAGDLVGDLAGAAKDIALGIINALIDGLNSLFPNEIGSISVGGREVFGGIDLPDDPIPRIELAQGGRVRARSGGVPALLSEAGWDELVLSTNPAMAGRNAGLLAGTGMADPALLNRIVSRVEQIAAVPRVGQLTLATASPQRHAIEFLDALDGAAWVRGA